MFKLIILGLMASPSVWAQADLQIDFRKNVSKRLENIRLAQEKAQEVMDSVLSLAQKNEEAKPLVSQFYYEVAQRMEFKSENSQIDTHRFLVSEYSPYLAALNEKDNSKASLWKNKLEKLDQKYHSGSSSYESWFENIGQLPMRFDDETCNQNEKEKLNRQLSLGFSHSQLTLLENGPLIQSWLSRGELKVSCLADKTDYSDQEHRLSVRPLETIAKIREALTRHLE